MSIRSRRALIHGMLVLSLSLSLVTSVMAEEHYRTTVIKSEAKRGDIYGQLNLGLLYYYGDSDVGLDYRKAHEWFLKSAKQGSHDAQIYLAIMYENGQGVRQDYTKAAEFYLKSAKQDNSEAQLSLGTMYEEGRGVSQSTTQAKEWYGKSCDNGYQMGCDAYRELNKQNR